LLDLRSGIEMPTRAAYILYYIILYYVCCTLGWGNILMVDKWNAVFRTTTTTGPIISLVHTTPSNYKLPEIMTGCMTVSTNVTAQHFILVHQDNVMFMCRKPALSFIQVKSIALQRGRSTPKSIQLQRLVARTILRWEGSTDTQTSMLPGKSRKRNVRSKSWWFTRSCNSHYVSHFAAFFIVVGT
jgi:hypothetical protein